MKKKLINILHAIDVSGTGGAETVFLQLVSRLQTNKKYNNIIVIPERGWIYDGLVDIGCKPIILNMQGSLNIRYLLGLLKIIRKNKIDIIQSHLLGSNVYCSLVGMITRVPVISIFHGAIDISSNEKFLRLKTFALNMGSKKIIFVSKDLMDRVLRKVKINKSKCQIIYNGINLKRTSKLKLNLINSILSEADDKPYVVGLVGNIIHAKGYDLLIRVVEKLKNENITFFVAGDTSDEIYSELNSSVLRKGLQKKIIFIGFCSDIELFMNSIDLYLLTSSSEGFSLSTIEAMNSGLPVISTKCGGPEEIITNNFDGVLVDNNEDLIASKILSLRDDHDVSKMLGENAAKTVRSKFALSKTINDYMNVYEELL